jgi:transposase
MKTEALFLHTRNSPIPTLWRGSSRAWPYLEFPAQTAQKLIKGSLIKLIQNDKILPHQPKGREQMGYKIGVDRKQQTLLPISLDEYISEEHICRVIDAFTSQVDIVSLGFKYAECKETGCRPYDPRMMLNLYLYGYLHRVRSSRRLQAEAVRNVEVMWLVNGLRPDDKTICNFRTDNTEALRKTFKTFVQMCRRLGLYGEETMAEDGTKFRANSSLKNHYGKTVVENELGRIEEKVRDYLKLLEEGDKEDESGGTPSGEAIKAALEELRERKVEYEGIKRRLETEGEVSKVDPDARLMRSGGDGREIDVCYNVQTVVDHKYRLIVDYEVTNNSSDAGNLYPMMKRAKEILEVEELTCLADKGFYDSEDIAACEANGITCLVAKKRAGGAVKTKEFRHEQFIYNAEEDRYTCPLGNTFEYKRSQKKNGGTEYRVYANYSACRQCPRRSECTSYKYRELWRLPYQGVLDIVDERTRVNKELYRKRQEIVEHVFGTVKAVWGYKQFLCRTIPKVSAEMGLAYMAYNMRRTYNIFRESLLMPVFT